uniref:Uncharacterized protein n=1 Tax=Tanacetum cinerariifolium TaxID=118510 RepID=A0A6L2JFB6_TANCI|nr:hypothetical protein [Tanacetum cinerariifolium]
MEFVSFSSNNSNSSNGVNTAQGINTFNGINTASSQPNSTHLVNKDLEQIHPDDLEKMELKTPAISLLRPFGCPVAILNTIDHLRKFDRKADESFFVGYSLNNSRPNWLFDIDALTKTMNYQPVVALSNDFSELILLLHINAASSSGVNVVGTNISMDLSTDLIMPSLEDIGIFEDSHDDEDVFGTEADFYNLDSTFQVSHIPTKRIHKDHPLEQVIRDLHSAPQTRRMSKNLEEHGLVGIVIPRTDNKDL